MCNLSAWIIQNRFCNNSIMSFTPLNLVVATSVTQKVTPLFPMRTLSLAPLQSCNSIDADAWCQRALTTLFIVTYAMTCINSVRNHNMTLEVHC